MTPFKDPRVAATFDGYPVGARKKLMQLRESIFAVAATTENVGVIEETLKWGEPAYLTTESRTGSTIRIAWKRSKPNQYAMYFICTTNLVETFRSMFPEDFCFEGNRAIVFQTASAVPWDAVQFCIATALTHRQNSGRSSIQNRNAASAA
jgi:Domain of unknown function (DU1801)